MAGKNGKKSNKQAAATIDFAAFRNERKNQNKPIVVDFGDEQLELPAQMPASVMLDLMAFQEDQKAQGEDADFENMPPELAMSIMGSLVGSEKMHAVAKRQQMDVAELLWLLEQLMSHYMSDIGEAEQGNGPARPEPVSAS